MAVLTKWDMLVPQGGNVVHNLIRNPSFEYNDQFFAGAHQYWYYYSPAGTIDLVNVPAQTSEWSSRGSRALALSLDGVTNRRVAYSPAQTTFNNWSMSISPSITTAASPTGVVYTSGNWAACVYILTPYGTSLAVMNDDDPVVSGNNLVVRSNYRQIDLTKGRSRAFFTSFSSFGGTVAARQVTFTMPATGTHDYPDKTLGYAVFVSTPTLAASGKRIYRLLTVKGGIPNGTVINELIPSDDTAAGGGNYYGYGSTTFLTTNTAGPISGQCFVLDSSGTEQSAPFIFNDASQPCFGVSGTREAGTTYGHHIYIDWYVDANYTAATSPFIACAYDYAVTVYDRNAGVTYTPTNYDTGTNRLAALPADRASAVRSGRSKFLLTPPNNVSTAFYGRNLELRIEVMSPTGSYTNNAAVLYIDCVQVVDITYRGDDDYDWDDVEFSYVDGDIAGAEWHDVAPSYDQTSGTTINGFDTQWYWLGDTYAGWVSTMGMPTRDRYISGNTAINNTFGGTTYRGYAQSFLRTPTSAVGTYVPIDTEHFGANVMYTSTGQGMPEIVTSAQSYGAIDGGIVQRQVSAMRTMQLAIEINGASTADLHTKRRRIINALKFDQLATQGTRVIRYRGSGTNVLFNVTYTAGLEFTGWQGVSFTENATVQFLCADPYVYAENAVSKRIVNPPLVQDTRFLMAYKKGDNQPWMYTGMKDYQAWTVGAGTISSSAPTTAPVSTLTITVTNASTLSTTLGSTSVTVTTGFWNSTAVDAGRTVFTHAGVILGVIATVTSATQANFASGATATFSGTTWSASTRTATLSSAVLSTANDAGKYIYTTGGGVTPPIASVSGTTITFSNYYFQQFNVAVGSANWLTIGTNTYGATNTFTGVNTGFSGTSLASPTDVGKIVYANPNTYSPPTTIGTITNVLSTTSILISLVNQRTGTISMSGATSTVIGSNTDFTANDVGKIIVLSSGVSIGRINSFTSSTQVTLQLIYAISVPAGTTFSLVSTAAVTSTSYTMQTPELAWTGGYKRYHIGIIESPQANTTAVIVGGFNNGSPAMGYGFSRYMAVFMMDGKQNTSAGNYSNSVPRTGTITTTATFPFTVTGVGTDFAPSDVGAAIYNTSNVLIGTIARWNSATSVQLLMTPTTAVTGAGYRTRSTALQPNPDYSAVMNIMNRNSTYSATGYYTLVPIGPITAIYQESPFSVLIAGTFQGYSASGISVSDIRIVRIKGWTARRGTTSVYGAASTLGAGDEDIEVLVADSTAGWGTPVINCITTDLNGNVYVGGSGFTTSYVWYIGRPNDGTYDTITQPLGSLTTTEVIALVTDTRFPIPNVFAAVDDSPYLKVYPYYNSLNSTGVWKDPPQISTGMGPVSYQAPDNLIYGFLRTQSGDIIVYGAFNQWGGTFGATVNGIGRLVPKITTYTQTQTYVDATPVVPAAGSYTQPGIKVGESVLAMADFSYPPTTGSYSGTGERLLFTGTFAQFNDGRYSLGMGYLEGSGNASSVRRMTVSDLGLSPPPSSTDYPYINAVTSTNRNRYYYANNQVNSTDNLVGPSAAILITKSTNGSDYANNIRYFQSGAGGYATTASYGIPQTMVIPLEVRGTANAYPVITATLFWRTTIYEIVNVETGARIRFDELYGIRGVAQFSGITETITFDFRPGYRTVTSNIRGNLMQFVSPDSDFSDFYLIAPTTTNSTMDTTHTNTFTFRYTVYHDTVGSNTPTVPRITVWYTPKFWSFDVPQLYKDAPDTPLM
jgi:hypothetical protein